MAGIVPPHSRWPTRTAPCGRTHAAESFRRRAEMTQPSVLALLNGWRPDYTDNRGVRWRVLQ